MKASIVVSDRKQELGHLLILAEIISTLQNISIRANSEPDIFPSFFMLFVASRNFGWVFCFQLTRQAF